MFTRVLIFAGKLSADPQSDCHLCWQLYDALTGEPATGTYAGQAWVADGVCNVAIGTRLYEYRVAVDPTPESVAYNAGWHHALGQRRRVWPGKRAEVVSFKDGWFDAWKERIGR